MARAFEAKILFDFILAMSTRSPRPEVGSRLRGRVLEIQRSGAILDLGNGLKGYLHESQISWLNNHATSLKDLEIGEEFDVVVLADRPTKKKTFFVSLSRLPTQTNPWIKVHDKHPVGSRVEARVVNFLPFGAVVEFSSGFLGFIHDSEISWVEEKRKARDLLRLGDEIEVVIQFVDAERRLINASYRQAIENPWNTFLSKYPIGSLANGRVESVKNFGVFISLENGCVGLLHHSQFSDSSQMFQIGDRMVVIVLQYDLAKHRIAFGLPLVTND